MKSTRAKVLTGIIIFILAVIASVIFVRSSTNEDQFYHRLLAVSIVGAVVFSILGPIIKQNMLNR